MKTGSINKKKIRAVLFDMDGLLVDSMGHHRDAWRDLLKAFKIKVSDQFIYENEGAMAPEVIMNLFREQGPAIDLKAVSAIYVRQNEKFITDYLPFVELFPQSLPLLQSLRKKGIIMGLVTGSRRNLIERIWKPNELEFFSVIVSADDTERFKPYPDPYLKAVKDMSLPLAACLVIENAPAGIQSALSAGLTCLAVASTLPLEKLSNAHQVFPDLASLSHYLNKTIS